MVDTGSAFGRRRVAALAVLTLAMAAVAVVLQPQRGYACLRAGHRVAATCAQAAALSIAVTPNPALVGEPVQISGFLSSARPGHQRVELWEEVGGQSQFAPVASVATSVTGAYTIIRPSGAVLTNRTWYVTATGVRSDQAAETVPAEVTLVASSDNPNTNQRVTLTGQVIPSSAGETVVVQQHSQGGWITLARPTLGPQSGFSIRTKFRRRQLAQLRVLFPGDPSNTAAESPLTHLAVGPPIGIHKIRHVVIIMQENRSFDSYFGTYPGADGIPHGICLPDPQQGGCVRPYHDPNDINAGADHTATAAVLDIDAGKMDGFIRAAEQGVGCGTIIPVCSACRLPSQVFHCSAVMGYHDAREIPNYWTYARRYVLQDHMFEPIASWSLPVHLFQMSEWSALCRVPTDPYSCHSSIESVAAANGAPEYAW